MTKTTPTTAWIESVDHTPLMDALSFVNAEIARLQNVRTALTDAIFPPTGSPVVAPAVGEPVPEWFIENMREKQRACGAAARKYRPAPLGATALAQMQLLDELLQQAVEGRS